MHTTYIVRISTKKRFRGSSIPKRPYGRGFKGGGLNDPTTLEQHSIVYSSRLPLAAWVSPDGNFGAYATSWMLAENFPVTEVAGRKLGDPAVESFKFDLFGYVCYHNGFGDNHILIACNLEQTTFTIWAVDSNGKVGKYALGSLPKGEILYGRAVFSDYYELDENGESLPKAQFALIGRGPRETKLAKYPELEVSSSDFEQQLAAVSRNADEANHGATRQTSRHVVATDNNTAADIMSPDTTTVLTPTNKFKVDVFKLDENKNEWTTVSNGDTRLDSCIVTQGDGGCLRLPEDGAPKKIILIRVNNKEDEADSEYDLLELPLEENEMLVGINRGPASDGDYHIVSIKPWGDPDHASHLFLTSVNFNNPSGRKIADLGEFAPNSQVSMNKDNRGYPIIKTTDFIGNVRLLYVDPSGDVFELHLPVISQFQPNESQPKSTE